MQRWYDDKAKRPGNKGTLVKVRIPGRQTFDLWVTATHHEGIEHFVRRETRLAGTLKQDGPDWVYEADA